MGPFTTADAQSGPTYRCRAQLQPYAVDASPKHTVAAISEWLSPIDIDLERSGEVLRFTTETRVTLPELRQQLHAVHFGVRGFSCFDTVTGILAEEGLPPFPQFEDTGDELADHARYETEKTTWISNHPGAYLRMTHPMPVNHVHR